MRQSGHDLRTLHREVRIDMRKALPAFACALAAMAAGLALAPPSYATTVSSWNRYVTRSILKTSIPTILGSCSSAYGGATEGCGGFPRHPRNTRLTPSQVNSSSWAVVELDNVVVRNEGRKYWGNGDGDACIGLYAPAYTYRNLYHKALHAELDYGWRSYYSSSQKAFGNLAAGTHVDVQGLVYWDSYHTTASFHYYSGWEIHPVFAWRYHTTTATASWNYIDDPAAQDLNKIIFGDLEEVALGEDEDAVADKEEAGD